MFGWVFQLGQQLLDAVRKQLQLPKGDAAADAALLKQHLKTPAAGIGSGKLNIGRLSGNKAGAGGGAPTGKHIVFSGDDLVDDFETQVQPLSST